MRLASCVPAVVALAFALGACGESSEEKAQTTVCDAKADIGKQVDELKSLTPATVSRGAVTESIAAITKDLDTISNAQGSLSGERRSELEAANEEFKAAVKKTAGQVVSSVTASDAKASLVSALQELGTSYQETVASLDCG